MSAEGGTKAVLAAMIANAGIAVSKFVAFLVTGSSSMLAESVHSVADTGNQGLLLLGGRKARRAQSAEHPFGHGRQRYFYAFVVALVLFSLGSLFALYEGYQKLADPHEISSAPVAIGVLLVAILLEFGSLRVAYRESNAVRGEQSWAQFIRKAKAPELPVVLLEDIGALVGLFLALAGVGLTVITDDPIWDGVGTVSIGVLLGVIAVVLILETKSLLIGETVSDTDERLIREALLAEPAIAQVIHLRTQYLGPEELLVAAKVEFTDEAPIGQVATAIDSAERRVRQRLPVAKMIYLEPDVFSAEAARVGRDVDSHPAEPTGPPAHH